MSEESQLAVRALGDVERRTFVGSQIYLPGWLILSVATGVLQHQPMAALAVAAGFALPGVARAVLHWRFARLVQDRPTLAGVLFRVLLLSGGAVFGGVTAASMRWPALAAVQVSLGLGAVVVCTAGTIALALDP